MIWALLVSFMFKSVQDTVKARRRGEDLPLSKVLRSNFIRLKKQIKHKINGFGLFIYQFFLSVK
jgi:hypothetical protein